MNICVFGSSITWGASDYEKGGWVERLKIYFFEKYDDISVYNLGVSGDTTEKVLKRFKNEAIIRKPGLIIFSIGVNDSSYIKKPDNNLVNLRKFNKNILKLIRLAKKITNEIVFIGLTRVNESKTRPVYWNDNVSYNNESLEKYDLVVKNICAKNNVHYIEMKKVIEKEELDDGLHPNSLGHEKIFKVVLGNIEKYIK